MAKSKKVAKVTKVDKVVAKVTKAKKTFVLFRPFVALGRYIRDSWRELRQVRWPNRKTTWKLVGAILGYTAIFIAFIILLDAFFTLIFNIILE